jgi:hypothetical protein
LLSSFFRTSLGGLCSELFPGVLSGGSSSNAHEKEKKTVSAQKVMNSTEFPTNRNPAAT